MSYANFSFHLEQIMWLPIEYARKNAHNITISFLASVSMQQLHRFSP